MSFPKEGIIDKFDFSGSYVGYDDKKTGLINGTFTLIFKGDCGTEKKYILQKRQQTIKKDLLFLENIKI